MATLLIQGDPGAIEHLEDTLLMRRYIGRYTDFDHLVVDGDLIPLVRPMREEEEDDSD